MEIEIPNGWAPRDYQDPLWAYLENGGKRAAAIWHRRAGKDANCLNWTATSIMEHPATYWHMLPKANQARKAIWTAVNPHTGVRLIDQAFPKEIRENTNDQEMFIRFKNGSTWQVMGSDNYDSLVGSPPYGVVFSEYSLCDPAAWDYLRPILAENDGWGLFIYTPRGRNHGYTLYQLAKNDPDWFGQLLTVDDTGAIDPEVIAREHRELVELYGRDEGEAIFQQEYYCNWNAAVKGSYYGSEMAKADEDGRVTNGLYEKGHKVYTAWDIGVGDDMVCVFAQFIGREIRIINHWAASGAGMEDVSIMLQEKADQFGYRYAEHYAPHDINVREVGTNARKRIDVARDHGIVFTALPQEKNIMDGIQAVRTLLPRMYWERDKTGRLRENMVSYQRKWDEKNKVFMLKPLHNFASHDADAVRTLARAYQEPNTNARAPTVRSRV